MHCCKDAVLMRYLKRDNTKEIGKGEYNGIIYKENRTGFFERGK